MKRRMILLSLVLAVMLMVPAPAFAYSLYVGENNGAGWYELGWIRKNNGSVNFMAVWTEYGLYMQFAIITPSG